MQVSRRALGPLCALLIATRGLCSGATRRSRRQPVQPRSARAERRPRSRFQPGFVDALGRWFDDSKSKIDEQIKKTTDAAKDVAGIAGQATDALVGPARHAHCQRPRTLRGVGQRRRRLRGGGADAVPRQGLRRRPGQLDINASQKCPAWVWLSGPCGAGRVSARPKTFVVACGLPVTSVRRLRYPLSSAVTGETS